MTIRNYYSMKAKLLAAVALLLLTALKSYAQNWLGLSNSNFGGIHSVIWNPAHVADNRHATQIHLVGLNVYAANNYMQYNGNVSFFRAFKSAQDDSTFWDNNLTENLDGSKKWGIGGVDIRGPGFTVTVDDKNGFGLYTRFRVEAMGEDIDQNYARIMRWGFKRNVSRAFKEGPGQLFYDQEYQAERFTANARGFYEIAGAYGREIFNTGKHYLKGGLTLKMLAPVLGLYAQYESGGITPLGTDSMSFRAMNVNYGHTSDKPFFGPDGNSFFESFGKNKIGSGIGWDLGVIWEYRPEYEQHKYTMDGKERMDPGTNKYKYRVGLSLNDMGKMNMNNAALNNAFEVRNFTGTNFNLDTFDLFRYAFDNKFPDNGMLRMDTVIGNFLYYDRVPDQGHLAKFASTASRFDSRLPSFLNLNIDYHIAKNLFVNLNMVQSLRQKNLIGTRTLSQLSITPRIEDKMLEFAMPIILAHNYRDFNLGMSFRFGPLYLGTDNFLNLIKKKNIYSINIYGGLLLPLFREKPSDKDMDGVSDKYDMCPTIQGLPEFEGCPDTDRDGIPDKDDECPTLPGLPEFKGCPDSDKDGIPDKLDECPFEIGLPQFNGCPDTDGDSIPDKFDECPQQPGPAKFKGCPDTDNDGIRDKDDSCPLDSGLAIFNGCPDRDGDGVPDNLDRCPDEPGRSDMMGCPDTDGDGIPDNLDKCPDKPGTMAMGGCPDTDGDGIPDHIDLCPLEAGPADFNGCPRPTVHVDFIELNEEEEKILREVFENLEFETGKAVIRSSSFASLDELSELMQTRKSYRLLIIGHTDNVGNKKSNQKLSEDRANSVKKYLTNKGVEAARINAEGVGDSRPVDTNSTPEGRQRNRRVEFKIIK